MTPSAVQRPKKHKRGQPWQASPSVFSAQPILTDGLNLCAAKTHTNGRDYAYPIGSNR